MKTKAPLRILYCGASPLVAVGGSGVSLTESAVDAIDLKLEKSRLIDALGQCQRAIELTIIPHGTIENLQNHLLTGNYDIFHFSGHGAGNGYLVFESGSGVARGLSGEELARLLQGAGVRLVFLSACHSETALAGEFLTVLESEIGAVVGFDGRHTITDRAARVFTETFYTALGVGKSVSASFEQARLRVFLDEEVGDRALPVNPRQSERPIIEYKEDFHFPAAVGELTIPEARRAPTNLRLPASGQIFVGRESSIAAVAEALKRQQSVMVHGEPGAGKTELARHFAAWADERQLFPGGIVWHSCETDLSLGGLLESIGLARHLQAQTMPDAREASEWLKANEALLVLDNCETLAADPDAARGLIAFVREITGAARLLLTGRRAELGLPGEFCLRLPGLAADPAAVLFRKVAGLPPFNQKSPDEPDVQQAILSIRELLGGLPLPLELGAKKMKRLGMKPQALLDNLRERGLMLGYLTADGQIARDARFNSYRVSLEATWETLSEPEKDILFAASCFRGFAAPEFETVLKIVGSAESWEDNLANLVDWSLVKKQAYDSGPRWSILPPIQEFAVEKASEEKRGGWDGSRLASVTRAHTETYADLAEKGAAGGDPTTLAPDRDNISLAADFLMKSDNSKWRVALIERFARVFSCLYAWWLPGNADALLRRAFEAHSSAPDSTNAAGKTAMALANLYQHRGQYDEALEWLLKSREISEVGGDLWGSSATYNCIGYIYNAWGQYDEALEWLLKSLEIKEKIGDHQGLGTTYNNISQIYHNRGDYDEALEWLLKSQAILKKTGDRHGLGATYNNIGQIYHDRGDYDEALEWLMESREIHAETDDRRGLGVTYNNLGRIYHDRGDNDEALKWLMESRCIGEEIGDRRGLGATYNNISQIYMARGDYDEALKWLLKSQEIRKEIGDRQGLGATYNNISQIYMARGDYDEALKWLLKSQEIRKEIGDRRGLGATLGNIASVLDALDRPVEAVVAMVRALQTYMSIDLENEAAPCLAWLAEKLPAMSNDEINAAGQETGVDLTELVSKLTTAESS